MRFNFLRLLTFVGTIVWMLNAHAGPVNISINPNAYTGPWVIVGETGSLTGSQVLSLDTDSSYTIRVGNNSRGQFNFDVDASGVVTSLNTDAADGQCRYTDF